MFNAKQNKQMLEVVDLLERADALLRKTVGSSSAEGYCISSAIECAMEDVLDMVRENNPEDVDA